MANRNSAEERRRNAQARRDARQNAENKAARQERRREYDEKYATDADRALVNNRGSKERRQERRDAWNSDGFDLNTYGNQHVSGQEMFQMRKDGKSASEIESMTDGMYMTKRATKQLNRKKAKELARSHQEETNTTVPETGDSDPIEQDAPVNQLQTPPPVISKPTTPTPPPAVTPGMPEVPSGLQPSVPTFDDSQTIGGNTGDIGKQGDMTTTIGDGNTIIGSAIGNDYSVTIGNTGNIDGGGGSGLSNMMGAAAYSALNDNAYYKSQGHLNGTGRSATAIALGEQMTGSTERVANLYNFAGMQQKYWGDKSNAQQGLYLGDVWNQGGHDWEQAPNPKSSKDRTEEILNS